jgi:GrpB-like predicted nucleotidyltransferase (UPF0157 family)
MSAYWPAWATQTIEIVAHDPAWADLAHELVSDLELRLHPWLDDGPIEHVGSTSVPGLAAKPVVDLMAPVRSIAACDEADPVLAQVGWHLVPPELDGRPWRRFYVLPEGDERRAHLHLVERSTPRWTETIAFRDALRSRPTLRAEYAELKRTSAEAHADDREAYTAAKSQFIAQALADA